MLKAIGRIFRTLGYLITGKLDRISSVWAKNPEVIGATFDKIVEEKRTRLNQYKDAVGSMVGNQEKKKITLNALSEDIAVLEKKRKGAIKMAVALESQYTPEALKTNLVYIKCKDGHRDLTSTLNEKNERVKSLEEEIKGIDVKLNSHKVKIETLMRELDKVKDEKHATIADITAADESKKISDLFSGISEDKTDQELQRMRDLRIKAQADERVSNELAGLDSTRAEDEFLAYADDTEADDEFARAIAAARQTSVPVTPINEKISEQ